MDALEVLPVLPTRSRLYSPEPMGMGTGLVESLASYLARLADSHLVGAADVLVCLAAGVSDTGLSRDHRIYNLMRLRSRELNGMQQIAQHWSRLVAAQTHRHGIEQLTLLPWRHILTPRALTHASQWWCPQCLDDWSAAGQVVYWPLLWSLRAVSVCPIHGIALEGQCYGCGAAVASLTARGRIGVCPKCTAWLGYASRPGGDGRAVQTAFAVGECAAVLAQGACTLLAAGSVIGEQLERTKLANLLDSCLVAANCRQAALARALGLSSEALHRLIGGGHVLNLPTLLNILAEVGVGIADFVHQPLASLVASGHLDAFVQRLPNKRPSAMPSRLKQGQRASAALLAEVRVTLEAGLAEEDPPALKTLAQHVGLTTVKLLWSHEPQLCRAIRDKRKARFNRQAAKEVVAALASSNVLPPTLETIAAQLNTSLVTLRRAFPAEVAAIKARRSSIQDVTELRRTMAAFLEVDPPVSCSEISRRLGIKMHHLRQHCPDVRQALVERFALYRQSCARARQRQECEAVRQAVASLHERGQFPTKSKVAAVLGKSRRMILTVTEREAFSVKMQELGLWQR